MAVHLYLDATGFMYLTGIAGTLILAFILFGSVLFSFGGGKFLTDLALSLTGEFRGGPAKAAVVGSSLFGMMSGSALSNIMVVGTVTIPLMKRTSYRSHVAAAIETVSSNGGMIMPPVMSIVAFIMADLIKTSYLSICIAAAIPAVLYYVALFIQVDLEAARYGMRGLPRRELPPIMPILRQGWLVLLPFFFLMYTLFVMKLAPEKAAVYSAIFGVLVLPLMKENRVYSWRRLLRVFEDSGWVLINSGTMLIWAGFILAAVGITGLGFKMSLGLVHLGSNNVWLLLFVAAISSMAMGMGLAASACYILVAGQIAPALVNLGMNQMASHLFVLYYGNMAMITPPIALGAFVAASVARANPMSTGWYAMRLAILSYIVPFLFVFSPSLLFQRPALYIAIEFLTAVLGTFATGVTLVGFLFRRVSWVTRVVVGLRALALFASIIMKISLLALVLKAAGVIVAGVLLWMELRGLSQAVLAKPGLF
jgi:TRAP transporter 4TM/12TM fusion protein